MMFVKMDFNNKGFIYSKKEKYVSSYINCHLLYAVLTNPQNLVIRIFYVEEKLSTYIVETNVGLRIIRRRMISAI
jgi:hypothetical protein